MYEAERTGQMMRSNFYDKTIMFNWRIFFKIIRKGFEKINSKILNKIKNSFVCPPFTIYKNVNNSTSSGSGKIRYARVSLVYIPVYVFGVQRKNRARKTM